MKVLSTRQLSGLAILFLLVIAACLMRMLIDRDPSGALGLAWPDPSYAQFRWTPMLNGIIAGIALAISGMLLQALLRNPLASPFILGISSGAGLGVMIALYIAYAAGSAAPQVAGSTLPATAGALGTLGVVYALGQRKGWIDPVSLILIGVVVATICSAGIMFFQHLVPTGLRGEFTTWLMGHIPESTSTLALVLTGSIASIGLVVAIAMGRSLDVATLGDDEARSVGLAIGPRRLAMFVLAGVLAAVAVAVVGPIGFVGLISPHVARLLLGPRHTVLALGAALCGAMVLVGSDVARQALDLGGGRMPPGIFTAIMGGPMFIWLLLTGRGRL
ncbi:MAG: FecCD family ABC transporter permease [Acidiferrobacterales bacterium]